MTIHCETECDLCGDKVSSADPQLTDWRTVNTSNLKCDFVTYHVCPKHDTAELLAHKPKE